ncbi:copper oxidase [Paenibacillus sp. HB172176]|uniref:multicopper oxidase family protein n=1 Tax=Paenibacillus sp. HB172176 TaxID=2493690 RepID=UPI0014388BF7|nr:copper oxidase [Paenibacillus sp. HB172176]
MVVTPDVPDLPYTVIQGRKFFELIAEPVERELLPGIIMKAWGYNGSTPGPTIRVNHGDWVTIRVVNRLPEPTTVHWHGLDVPNAMDGVPDVEPSPRIDPDHFFDYSFRITNPPGTHMYHTNYDTVIQQLMGMSGAFIIEDPGESLFQRDYFLMLQEFHLDGLKKGVLKEGVYSLNPLADGFNFFAMNGRCYPHTSALPVKRGELVRIRIGNIGMSAHPMHLHGHQFVVIASDGNAIPLPGRETRNTLAVPSGVTHDIAFLANNPGVWPFHCHMPHHSSNNFTKPTGGMFTTVSYRE